MINIPENCKFIFDTLNQYGFSCYAVGGCVRDSLMGRTPADWDFTTNATPAEIETCFCRYKTLDIGRNFGTITVINEDNSYEITTFRRDGEYSDSRHPDAVEFTTSVIDDLSRRDFTMNSIAYSPESGLIDPFGGAEDIKRKTIRCTGEANLRFNEDAIRILRALRFASVLGFGLEESTREAVFSSANLLSKVHPSRMRKELSGLLCGDFVSDVLSEYRDAVAVIIPEIARMFDISQNNPHHKYDVWHHTLEVLRNSAPSELVRICALFHDIGKPLVKTTDKKGIDHFKKHQQFSAEIAENVLRRFCYPSETINDAVLLIRNHDERFRDLRFDVKRMLSTLGERRFYILTELIYADILGQSDFKREQKLAHREAVIRTASDVIKSEECYTLSELSVNGNDMKEIGLSGKAIGSMLNLLLENVMANKLKNDREVLISYAFQIADKLNSAD